MHLVGIFGMKALTPTTIRAIRNNCDTTIYERLATAAQYIGKSFFPLLCASRPNFLGCQKALNADEDQRKRAHNDIGPPGAKRPVELDQGLGDTQDKHAKQRAKDIT